MPDSLDLALIIGEALDNFSFSNYGCDDIDEIMADESLDLRTALVNHILIAVERLLEN